MNIHTKNELFKHKIKVKADKKVKLQKKLYLRLEKKPGESYIKDSIEIFDEDLRNTNQWR
jgi:hypothetical protein